MHKWKSTLHITLHRYLRHLTCAKTAAPQRTFLARNCLRLLRRRSFGIMFLHLTSFNKRDLPCLPPHLRPKRCPAFVPSLPASAISWRILSTGPTQRKFRMVLRSRALELVKAFHCVHSYRNSESMHARVHKATECLQLRLKAFGLFFESG